MLLFLGSVYFDVQQYGRYNRFVPGSQQQEDKETKAGGESRPRGNKTFSCSTQVRTRTHSMARHRKSPRSRRNLMVIEGHQFDRR